ncbi:helix-turn-helix domain-containing protein [uncultured Microbacterium sp.]|uniref:AraC-like ligand-binding domain-containing protein n=1 Tax=uncultured Microbacterium sp. TaxID=191216 RepID=UPI002611B74A|nr:helix-turn-helix domain-containing protein [uncultured Microbacterium sp.]
MPTLAAPDTALGFTQFRAAVNDSFVPLQVTSDNPGTFRGSIRHAASGGVHVAVVDADDHVVERTPALIAARPRSCFKVGMQLAGHGLLMQDGREVLLRPGMLAIYDTEQPYSLAFDGPFRSLVVMLPAADVDLPLEAVSELTAVALGDEQDGAGALILPFLRGLAEHPDALTGPVGPRLARSTVDMISTLLSQQLALRGAGADPRERLFADVLNFIDLHLAAPDLDPAAIAAAHFISQRSLHALFHENGDTVAKRVRRRRLEQCRIRLADAAYLDHSIMRIASAWGFIDAAHFSRAYRAEFGCSPSQTRSTTIKEH